MLAETCYEINRTPTNAVHTPRTPAETWLSALQGENWAIARQDLRVILLQGLCACLKDRRPEITGQQLDQIVERSLDRVLDRLERFPGRRRFTSWALKIAVRTALSFPQQS